MTAKEAKENQDRIAKNYKLEWWYGTKCEKCCGVYPKLMFSGTCNKYCYYQCEVCGKRTEKYSMPWLARDAWNNREYKREDIQMSFM